jgi:hypothetical protein
MNGAQIDSGSSAAGLAGWAGSGAVVTGGRPLNTSAAIEARMSPRIAFLRCRSM